jgi:glycosyltransferase involved in cell wall biosynthesis
LADKIIVISNAVSKRFSFTHHHSKLKIIYNGVDLSTFNQPLNGSKIKKELGIGQQPVVGMVSRLIPSKGHKTLVKAAECLLNKGYNVKYLIIGDVLIPGDKYLGELKALVHRLGLHNHILFLGAINNVPEVLKIIDIGVLPSFNEGFGRVIIEYMAAGKPVVATNVGGIPEIVVGGRTGYLVPCGDADSLARSIVSLIDNSVSAKKMGENGRIRAEKLFSNEKNISETQELYLEILSRKQNRVYSPFVIGEERCPSA